MPFITRDDGERFVIPSYRDVMATRQHSQLKKEILLLSQNYGEYITLQKKGTMQYEVAFASEAGYLLGESIWNHFKRPLDLIYCEAIPNTTDAILVIVKAGSVYLDGSFPLDSIPEELVVFLTQENHFDIYTYGDVPISQQPVEGKFSFDTASVKTFTVLDKPVFQTLPLLKVYQLELVDNVLIANNIGVFPTKKVLIVIGLVLGLWMLYSRFSNTDIVQQQMSTFVSDPYLDFVADLSSPSPDKFLAAFVSEVTQIFVIPGWKPISINCVGSTMTAQITTQNSSIEDLLYLARKRQMKVNIQQKGIFVTKSVLVAPRARPTVIYPIEYVTARMLDVMRRILPGTDFKMNEPVNKGAFKQVIITISSNRLPPFVLLLIGQQLKDLPIVVQAVKLNVKEQFGGSITLEALGY